jgi:hypothetical protein
VNACKRHANSCIEYVKNRCHFEDLDVSGRIILKFMAVNHVDWMDEAGPGECSR